jgi:hypothetical protein
VIPLRPTGYLPSEFLATRVIAYVAGRSSGLRTVQPQAEFLPAVASQSLALFEPAISAELRLSFSLTAAGQPRNLTGFPIKRLLGAPATKSSI